MVFVVAGELKPGYVIDSILEVKKIEKMACRETNLNYDYQD